MTHGPTKGIPLDTDGTLAANSDQLVATQKATKTYANTKQALDATLTALAAANWAADALPIGTGADTLAQTAFAANTFPAKASTGNLVAKAITDAALTVLDDTTVAAMRTTLGIAGAVGGVEWTVITKASDESVTSSTTLQVDDELLFTTVSGAIYEAELIVIYVSPVGAGVGDFKFTFSEDSSATRGTLFSHGLSTSDVGTSATISTDSSASLSLGTGATNRVIKIHAQHVGNGGSLALRWAQATSDGNAVTVKAGSVLRYRRIL